MRRRQTNPKQWLIVDRELDPELWKVLRRLAHGSGILIVHPLRANEHRQIRLLARLRGHRIAVECRGKTVRAHSLQELTRAMLRRPNVVLLSPLFETHSHPDWKPLPPMRAAALARLCRGNAVALGGMNEKRYLRVADLGFDAWAGISAFRT